MYRKIGKILSLLAALILALALMSVTVFAAGELVVSPNSIKFMGIKEGYPDQPWQTVTITNVTEFTIENLSAALVGDDTDCFILDASSLSAQLNPNESTTVRVNLVAGLSEGPYWTTLYVTGSIPATIGANPQIDVETTASIATRIGAGDPDDGGSRESSSESSKESSKESSSTSSTTGDNYNPSTGSSAHSTLSVVMAAFSLAMGVGVLWVCKRKE